MATVNKRGNKYRIRVYMGYDTAGRQIERTKTWTAPPEWSEKRAMKEAQRQAVHFEEEVKNGLLKTNMKFAEFSEYWLKMYAEDHLRPKTVFEYRKLLANINLSIGHLPLDKITPIHLLEFYNRLSETTNGNTSYYCQIDIKAELQNRHCTQADFAEICGISLTTLQSAMQGKAISHKSSELICDGLNKKFEVCFRPVKAVKKISSNTIRHYHRLISSILGYAVRWQYIPYNPCSRITPPKTEDSDISYLDDEQAKRLLILLQSEAGYYRRAIAITLMTGLRRGELLGLEWGDVNWKEHTIMIRRTSQYLPGKGVFTDTTKNKSSQRLIHIPQAIITVLIEQKQWQEREAERLGDLWQDSNRIITNEIGMPMYPDSLTHWFEEFIKRNDLPKIHLHSLRHTYATLCIANNVPLTTVAAQLGHATVATTANIYAHAVKSSQIMAANKIGQIFEDIL